MGKMSKATLQIANVSKLNYIEFGTLVVVSIRSRVLILSFLA